MQCTLNSTADSGKGHLLRLNLSLSAIPGPLTVQPARPPGKQPPLIYQQQKTILPLRGCEDLERLTYHMETDDALFFHLNDALRHLRLISSTFSSASEHLTLATSYPLAAELLAPVKSCSLFKSILTPNTSLFSQPACPKYFPPALTERVFTGQLQNNKFPFLRRLYGELCGVAFGQWVII